MSEENQRSCCFCCRPPPASLKLREGLSLQPLAGEPHPARFAGSAWSADLSVWLLTYRLLLACLCTAVILWSVFSVSDPRAKWLIYLTHWGIVAVSTYCIVACILVFCIKFIGHPDHKDGLHWSFKIYWSLYNIACPTAFMITVFYWTMLHGSDFDDSISDETSENSLDEEALEEEENQQNFWRAASVLNVMVHGVNSAIMLLEILLVALPSRLLHFYQPFLFGIVYVLFNAIYYLAGGTDYVGNRWVYSMVDWTNLGPTILVVVLTALLLAGVHAFTVVLSIFRDILVQRFNTNKVYVEKEVKGHTNPTYKHDV